MIGGIRRGNAAERFFLCAILLALTAPVLAQETGPGTSIKGIDQRVTSIDEGVNLRINGANVLQDDEQANRHTPPGASKWGPAPTAASSTTGSPAHESSFNRKLSSADRGAIPSPDENKPEVTGNGAAQKAGKLGAGEAPKHGATRKHSAVVNSPDSAGKMGSAFAREKQLGSPFARQNGIPAYGHGSRPVTAKAKPPAANSDKDKMKAGAEKLPSGLPHAQNSSSRKLGAALPNGNLNKTAH